MLNPLLKPKSIHVETISDNKAKVTLEPFERGYGHTLGNALRRVLLSSMVGHAPTEVVIAGVLHEYSSIDGVQEDVVGLLLNLKGVVFKLHNRDEVTLSLRKEGEGVVTAADIQTPHDVEIVNPEHIIATMGAGAKLDMQIKVINEYRLHLGEASHRQFLQDTATRFFCLDGGDGTLGSGPEGGLNGA